MAVDFAIQGKYVVLQGQVRFGVSEMAAAYLKSRDLVLAPMFDPGHPEKKVPILAIITRKEFGSDSDEPPTWEKLDRNDLLDSVKDSDSSCIKIYKGQTVKLGKTQIRVSKDADKLIEKADGKGKIDDLQIREIEGQKPPTFVMSVSEVDTKLKSPKNVFCLNIIEEID